MQIKLVNLLLVVLFSAVLAYGLASCNSILANYIAAGGFAFFAGTLSPIVAVNYEYARSALNLRILSGVFFVLGLAINGLFAFSLSSATAYIVISAIALLIYLFLASAIYGTRQ